MKFLWHKWILGIIKRSLQAAISYLGAAKLSEWGVQVNTDQLAVALFAGLEALRSYLKHKVGLRFL